MTQRVWGLITRSLTALALTAVSTSPLAAQFGTNLIVNGGAEASAAGAAPSGWSATGPATVVSYTAGGGFPDLASPGSPNRGTRFFSGGDSPESAGQVQSVLSQSLSLSPYVSQISAGAVTFTLRGWLGGFSNQADNAAFSAVFLDGSSNVLLTFTLGPVGPQDRNLQTGMVERLLAGVVPPLAREVRFTLTMTRFAGQSNDGYADDLSFVLGQTATQPPVPGVVPEPASAVLMCTGLGVLGLLSRRKRRTA